MRAIIDLPAEQVTELQASCEREGISRAEAVRRAIALYIAQQVSDGKQKSVASGFGLWRTRAMPDAVDYQRDLRADWD